jgi:hypothetical protein
VTADEHTEPVRIKKKRVRTEAQKAAKRAYFKRQYQANPEKFRQISRESAGRNKAAKIAYDRRYYAENRDKFRAWKSKNYHRIRKYRGLPDPTRETPATCECCGGPPGKKRLALDHCHATNVFRGWLCFRCNIGFGMFGDNADGLKKALQYLERCG